MRPPCEFIVRSVLPSFRSLVARRLVQDYNYSQVAAAKKLATTQASVSNYLYSKRGKKMMKQIENSPIVLKMVDEIAKGIVANKFGPIDSMLQFCKLCEAIKSGDLLSDDQKRPFITPKSCNV